MTDSFHVMKDAVFAAESKITMEFATDNFKMNAFHCILFQGGDQFNHCASKLKELWSPIVETYIDDVKEVMSGCVRCLRSEGSTNLFSKLISQLDVECK